MSALPPDLKARVLQSVREVPSPTRDSSRAHAWLVLPAGVVVGASIFFAFGGLSHGQGRPTWFYLASTLGWAAVAALSAWGALGRGGSATGRAQAWLMAVAVGTPALLFAMMFAFALVSPEVTRIHPERLGLKCMGLTVAAAAFPLVALLTVRQGSDPVHPAATGAALGAACGASAGVIVEMWCPVAAPMHVLIGHIFPIALLALFGGLLGARLLKMGRVSR